ncbi:MAG TPA: prepilin peptidase [Kiritimatiellia bacterium]|nr:prepilin peptidase [Kiritimatiellia bacterium]HMO99952.1 prepilin peptidase [Kiritimatiellia bacterium]HMP97038.1 prepilin peptidase [Kiritimatiellia bacterium]
MTAEFLAWYGPLVSLVVGLCIGSFLNVCIYRIPLERSIVRPGSFCPACQTPIAWFDNIPVLSYLLLGGRCRHCRARISPRYPLIELLTGILFVAVWNRYGLGPETLVFWVAMGGLVIATFVDLEHMIIPDSVSIGGMVFGLAVSALVPALHDADGIGAALIASGIGLVFGFGLLWLVAVIGRWVFKKDAMGFGDVKLLGAIGALLGAPAVIYTILVSSLIGTLIGVIMIAIGGREWQSRLPYGPYLAIGAGSWILGGDALWAWYVRLISGG